MQPWIERVSTQSSHAILSPNPSVPMPRLLRLDQVLSVASALTGLPIFLFRKDLTCTPG